MCRQGADLLYWTVKIGNLVILHTVLITTKLITGIGQPEKSVTAVYHAGSVLLLNYELRCFGLLSQVFASVDSVDYFAEYDHIRLAYILIYKFKLYD